MKVDIPIASGAKFEREHGNLGSLERKVGKGAYL
jgi:hypothetical protein